MDPTVCFYLVIVAYRWGQIQLSPYVDNLRGEFVICNIFVLVCQSFSTL